MKKKIMLAATLVALEGSVLHAVDAVPRWSAGSDEAGWAAGAAPITAAAKAAREEITARSRRVQALAKNRKFGRVDALKWIDVDLETRIARLLEEHYPTTAIEPRGAGLYEQREALQRMRAIAEEALSLSSEAQETSAELEIAPRDQDVNVKVIADVNRLAGRLETAAARMDAFFSAGYGTLKWDDKYKTTGELLYYLYYYPLSCLDLPKPDWLTVDENGDGSLSPESPSFIRRNLLENSRTAGEKKLAESAYRAYEKAYKDFLMSLWKAYQPYPWYIRG